jgi:hypothetical protein
MGGKGNHHKGQPLAGSRTAQLAKHGKVPTMDTVERPDGGGTRSFVVLCYVGQYQHIAQNGQV